MKTLIIAAATVAFMGSTAVYADETTPVQEQAVQTTESSSAFEGVETVVLSSEDMKIEAGLLFKPTFIGMEVPGVHELNL